MLFRSYCVTFPKSLKLLVPGFVPVNLLNEIKLVCKLSTIEFKWSATSPNEKYDIVLLTDYFVNYKGFHKTH